METLLRFDGSFNGYLSAVSLALEEGREGPRFLSGDVQTGELFDRATRVHTDTGRARELWNRVTARRPAVMRTAYFAFMTESPDIADLLFRYLKENLLWGRSSSGPILTTKEERMRLERLARKVGSEKRRWEREITWQLAPNGLRFAILKPRYNILPLLGRAFRNRMPGVDWAVIDIERGYVLQCQEGTTWTAPFDLAGYKRTGDVLSGLGLGMGRTA